MKKLTVLLTSILVGSLLPGVAFSQDADPHALDGTELEYTYTDGGTVVLNFYDGLVKFRWVAGPNEGQSGEGFPYRAKLIGNDRYMVIWQMVEARNYMTMVVDLGQRALFTSGLLSYGTDDEAILFEQATIHRVER